MVINIPNESEASDANVIFGCLIEEEVEIQSTASPPLQQSQETDAMARTRKPQTISTPGLRLVLDLV